MRACVVLFTPLCDVQSQVLKCIVANISRPRLLSLLFYLHRGASLSSCLGDSIYQSIESLFTAPTRDIIRVTVVKIPSTTESAFDLSGSDSNHEPNVLVDTTPSTLGY